MNRTWYPDQQAHAGPEHLDAAYVAGYDSKAGLEPAVLEGGPRAQHELFNLVEPAARRKGFGDVIDGWEPDLDWLRGRCGYRASRQT